MPNINKEVSIGYKGVDRQVDFIFPFDNPATPAEMDANTAELQRAIDFAEEKGNKLVFDRETYRFSHSVFLGTDAYVDFNGATIIYMPQTTSTITSFLSNKSYLETNKDLWNSNITVKNGRWDTDPTKGNAIGFAHARDIEISNMVGLENIFWHLVDLAGVEDVRVFDNESYNTRTVPYQVDTLSAAGGLAVELPDHTESQATVDGTGSKHIHFYDNIADGGPDGNPSHAFQMHRDGGSDIHIYKNKIRNFKNGVYLDPDVTWSNIYIEDNVFDQPILANTGNTHGIYFRSPADRVQIRNNTFSPLTSAVLMSGSESANPQTARSLIIDNNYVAETFRQAFRVEYYDGYTISNNIVEMSYTAGAKPADAASAVPNANDCTVKISNSKRGTMFNNTFRECFQTAVVFKSSDFLMMKGNTVTDFGCLIYMDGTAERTYNLNVRNNVCVPEGDYAYFFLYSVGLAANLRNRFIRTFDNTLARVKEYGTYLVNTDNVFDGDNVYSGIGAKALFYFRDSRDIALTSKSNNFNTDEYIHFDGANIHNVTGYIDVWNHQLGNTYGDRTLSGTTTQIFLHSPSVSVKAWQGSQQLIPSGVTTKIAYDGETIDAMSCYDPAQGEYTVKVTGWYEIKARVTLRNTTVTDEEKYSFLIYKNGARISGYDAHTSKPDWFSMDINDIIYCVSGDLIDFRIRHDTGTDVQVIGGEQVSPMSIKTVQFFK